MVSQINRASKEIINEGDVVKIKIEGKKGFLDIPKKALSLFFDIINTMADGKSITLIPSDSEISTQLAANLLKISRPHLITLLEEGKIPFRKTGTHRRIEVNNLIKYQSKLQENRIGKLSFLAKQAQELNLGY